MQKPDELNPFSPPKANIDAAAPSGVVAGTPRLDPAHVAAALARLKQHVASPDNLAADGKRAGGRLRAVTVVFVALFGIGIPATLVAAVAGPQGAPLPVVTGVVALFFALTALILVAIDLSIVKRGAPTTPDVALKSYLKAFASGRNGYAWAALCPTAREQTVAPPKLGVLPTGDGQFDMRDKAGIKGYAQAFARPGHGRMRTCRVRSVAVRRIDGDVALVQAEIRFQSWPMWVTIMIGVCAAVFRLGMIVGLILYFVMRKRLDVTIERTLLQGQPGVWYLGDANLLEGYQPGAL